MRWHHLMILAVAACGTNSTMSEAPDATAVGTAWSLVELDGKPAGFGANGKPATLVLNADDLRASGYAGCNQFSGTYTLAGSALTFGPLAMTRMYCQQGQALEDAYAKALAATTGQRVSDGKLELLAGGRVVARLRR